MSRYRELRGRTRLYFNAQQYDSAIKELKIAIKEFPEVGEFFNLLADCYLRKREFDQAISFASQAMQKDSTSTLFHAYVIRAEAYFEKREYVFAKLDAFTANTLEQNLRACLIIADIYFIEKNFSGATHYYALAMRQGACHPDVYAQSAEAYFNLDLMEKALEHADCALSLDSTHIQAHYIGGCVYEFKKDWDKALAYFLKARAIAYSKVSFIYRNKMNLVDAEKYATLAIREEGTNEKHYINRGEIFLLRDNGEGALRDANKAIFLNPNNVHGFRLRAKALLLKKQFDDALKGTEIVLQQTLSPQEKIDIHLLRADIFIEKNNLNEARQETDCALKINILDIDCYVHLARISFLLNNYDNAITYANQALKLSHGNNDLATRILIEAHLNLKNFAKASQLSDEIIQKDENHYYGFFISALAYQGNNEFGKALERLTRADALTTDLIEKEKIQTIFSEIYVAEENFSEALAHVNQALTFNDQPYYYGLRAQIYISLSEGEKAVQDASHALLLRPDYHEMYLVRASAYSLIQYFIHVITDATTYIQSNPNDAMIYRLRAEAFLKNKFLTEAANDIQIALEKEPNEIDNHLVASKIYHESKKYLTAITHINIVIKHTAENSAERADAEAIAASIEYCLGNFPQALECANAAIKIMEKHPHARLVRSLYYIFKDELDKALEDSQTVIDEPLSSTEELAAAKKNCAQIFLLKRNLSVAIDYATKSIFHFPNNPLAYTIRAEAYRLQGQSNLALDDANMAIQLDNDTLEARIILAHTFLDNRNLNAAIQEASWLIEHYPHLSAPYAIRAKTYLLNMNLNHADLYFTLTPETTLKLHFENDTIYVNKFDNTGAEIEMLLEELYDWFAKINLELEEKKIDLTLPSLEDLTQKDMQEYYEQMSLYHTINDAKTAIQKNEGDFRISPYSVSSTAYVLLGKMDDAITQGITAINLNPQDVDAHIACASAYFAKKQYKKAIHYADQVITLDPERIEAYHIRSESLEKQNKSHFRDQYLVHTIEEKQSVPSLRQMMKFTLLANEATVCTQGQIFHYVLKRGLTTAINEIRSTFSNNDVTPETLAQMKKIKGELPRRSSIFTQLDKIEAKYVASNLCQVKLR